MPTVLVLRPEPGATATARKSERLGLCSALYPLFHIEPVAWRPPAGEDYDALMITSANAVRHAGKALRHFSGLPAFAVGRQTADALRSAGFVDIAVGDTNAQALIRMMESKGHARVLHLCGEEVRPVDPGTLHVSKVAVYRAVEAGNELGLLAAAQKSDVLLVHSPRAGERLAYLSPIAVRAKNRLVAISAAAAQQCGSGWASIDFPDTPSDTAMLAIARRICQI